MKKPKLTKSERNRLKRKSKKKIVIENRIARANGFKGTLD